MKIKRFHANNMRNTIRKVREELGADAVILSNRHVADGVEIIAAIDYDESLLPVAEVETKTETQPQQETQEPVYDRELDARFTESLANDIVKIQPPTTEQSVTVADNQEVSFAVDNFNVPSFQETVNVANKVPEPEARPAHIWSEEPVIVAMQDELKSLRGLLVNQLSGLAWGHESRYHPLRARLLQRLLALGLSSSLAKDIASECKEQDSFEQNWRLALGKLAHRLPVASQDIIEQGGIIALVGPTGVGKTTTIAKLATRYALRHGSQDILLITTDNQRVAAHEQLRSYARILGVPMRVAADVDGLQSLLSGFRDKKLILIDTAGMSQIDMQLSEQMAMLHAGTKDEKRKVQVYLTLATNTQRKVLEQVAGAFKDISLAGTMLTKLDETASLGGALSVAVEHALPIAYFCDGQQVPDDIHLARQHTLVSRSVSIVQQLATSKHDDKADMAVGGMLANANR